MLVYIKEASSCLVAPYLWHLNKRTQYRAVDMLRSIVANKRVLIVGSGPSVQYIDKIPQDVVVLSCNFSSALLSTEQKVTGLLTTSFALKDSPQIVSLLKTRSFDWLAYNKKTIPGLSLQPHRRTAKYIQLFAQVIDTQSLLTKRMKLYRKGQWYFFSSGVQLVLLAIMAESREIYISGIEASPRVVYPRGVGYTRDEAYKMNRHLHADDYALREIARTHPHVYSLHTESSLSELLPCSQWGEIQAGK